MKRTKIEKYIWVPLLLLIYLGAMTWIFGRELIASGQSTRLWTTCGVELIIIIGVYFFLRKKKEMADRRNNQ